MAKNILIVEDDSSLSEIMKKKFTDSGFKPIMAATGRQALDYLESKRPDLIILDILLPDIDGVTVLNELAHNKETKTIPILIFSNLGDEGSLEQIEAVGRYDYLLKFKTELSQLVGKVKEKLGIGDK